MNQNYETLLNKVKELKVSLTSADAFYHNLIHGRNEYTHSGAVSKNRDSKFFGKLVTDNQGIYGSINLRDMQERELAHIREAINLYITRIEQEKEEGEAKIKAIEELLS